MFKIGSIASGMGMHLHGLKKIGGVPVWAIECDEAIARCYQQNHPESRIICNKVQDVAIDDLEDIDCLTVTLSCKNASISRGADWGETEQDTAAATAAANILRGKLPKFFLLENVWRYRTFESFRVFQSALAECGYYFRYYKLNCKDWGVAQSRDRLYGVGVRHGAFWDIIEPSLPILGWHEAIADLIPELPEVKLAPWQIKKFPQLDKTCLVPDSSNWTSLVSVGQPALTVRAGHQSFKALIKHAGGGRDNDRLYHSDEPSFTIRALGRSADHHSKLADAIVGDRVVAVTPRACLRFFGDKETADSIWLPPTKSLAMEVVGNGASWVMFEALMQTLLATSQKPFFVSVA